MKGQQPSPRKKPETKKPEIDLDALPFDVSSLSEESQLVVSILIYTVESYKIDVNKTIQTQDAAINALKNQVTTLEEKVESLENKLDAAEAIERKNEIVISGMNVPVATPGENISNTVSDLFRNSFRLSTPPTGIVKCHRIGKKPRPEVPDRRNILVKLSDEDTKNDLIATSKRIRADGIYLNESLSPIRKTIMYVLRKAKKEFPTKVSGCTSLNGSVFVWIKPPNPNAANATDTRMMVNTYSSLDKFCTQIIESTVSHFIGESSLS